MSSSDSAEGKCLSAIPSVLPCQSNVHPPTSSGTHPVSSRTRSLAAVEGSSDELQILPSVLVPVLPCLDTVESLKQMAQSRGLGKVDGQCHKCLKVFKGKRGVGVHLSKVVCVPVVNSPADDGISASRQIISSGSMVVPEPVVQSISQECTVSCDDSQEDSQVNFRHNSAVLDDAACLQEAEERLFIRWPALKEVAKWRSFEKQVIEQLPPNMNWPARLELLQNVVYSVAAEKFGCIQPSVGVARRKSRREMQIARVRQEIRDVAWQLRNADHTQKYPLECLLLERKQERNRLRRAENGRKRRKERCRLRKSFYQDPFKVAKQMVSPTVPTQLCVEKAVLDDYVEEVATDPMRDVDLGELSGLPETPAKEVELNVRPFTFTQFRNIVRRKRTRSRPGPNKIPYSVYKRCPQIARYLFEIFQAVRREKKVPLCWRTNDGIMIPKVASPTSSVIGDFRQIALLNVEGKLFWSLVADRLYNYLVVDNSYISPEVQKGSMKKVAGCWEHTAMVWSALKNARKSKNSLAVLWLDLANAYGSVPHKLIVFALRRYGVPEDWISLIMAYYDGLWGRTSASGISSDWKRYERGIFAGCTISVILFVAAFNVILEYVDAEGISRYRMSNGNRIGLLRGFMDDVSILTSSVDSAKKALKRTEVAVAWARMKLKPGKSRSLVIKKGRSMDVEPFVVGADPEDEGSGEVIPALQRKPLKTLGRWYDPLIRDDWYRVDLKKKLEDGLKLLNKSHAKGAMKLWALHHILLLQIRWDLMVYEIPVSFVEKLEMMVNRYIRRWLGVCRNLTNVALYSKKSVCPLPFSSLVTMYKTTKVNAHVQLVNSKHKEVVQNVSPSSTGRKWKLYDPHKVFGVVVDTGVIRRCELMVKCGEAVGNVAQGRMGLEYAGGEEGRPREMLGKRKELVNMVVAESEEEYLTRAVQMGVQGRWTAWKDLNQRVISWRSLVYGDPRLYRFCIGATFDTLSSPANLKRWGLESSDKCCLCGVEQCTVRHVLSGCKVALSQGRYRYRHDCVLRVICHHLAGFINRKKVSRVDSGEDMRFVRAGVSSGKLRREREALGLLKVAEDWIFLADLEKRLVFPVDIVVTSLRPDIVVYSHSSSTIIMVELTCPCEENIEVQHNKKLMRYQDLKADCEVKGWKVYLFAVEVGARGYTGQSLSTCLKSLGLRNRPLRSCLEGAGDEALRTSFWVWFLKENDSWDKVGFSERKQQKKRKQQQVIEVSN